MEEVFLLSDSISDHHLWLLQLRLPQRVGLYTNLTFLETLIHFQDKVRLVDWYNYMLSKIKATLSSQLA